MKRSELILFSRSDIPFSLAFGYMPNGSKNTKISFMGKHGHNDAQLYYFNARWYDPNTARFITEDPIRDGLLWYAYCNNNPLKYIDPTGLRGVYDDEEYDDRDNNLNFRDFDDSKMKKDLLEFEDEIKKIIAPRTPEEEIEFEENIELRLEREPVPTDVLKDLYAEYRVLDDSVKDSRREIEGLLRERDKAYETIRGVGQEILLNAAVSLGDIQSASEFLSDAESFYGPEIAQAIVDYHTIPDQVSAKVNNYEAKVILKDMAETRYSEELKLDRYLGIER